MSKYYYYREFKDILFMGASQPGCTEFQILKLQKLVADCLTESGGLQQPPHSESEEMALQHEREYEQGRGKVKEMVKDIAMALTGEEIRFPCDIEQDTIDDEFERVINDLYHGEEDDLGELEDDEDEECKEGTILDALETLSDRVINALDERMLDEDCGQWWLARAKRIIKEALKDE